MCTIGTSLSRFAVACGLAVALTALAATTVDAAGKLYVANNGTDNLDCGPVDRSPCRSISRAIAHASPGDQIIVGPGFYGDVNRNRAIDPSGDSGEESPVDIGEVQLLSGIVHLAMINVDKPLTIVSRDGAGATVIDADTEFINGSMIAVNLGADGVIFGKKGKGFTIRNAALGLYVNTSGTTIGGTIVDTCYSGFMVGSASGNGMAAGTVLKGNAAVNAPMGGFLVNDETAVVKGNLAKANSFTGFGILGGAYSVITKNVAVGNLGYGFFLAIPGASLASFTKNAAVGNADAGVFVAATGTAPASLTVAQNTIYGNGVHPQYPPTNCGLVTQNSGVETLTVDADGNYWGAATGPGADPADAAGGTCSAGTVTLNLTESASSEIKVKPPAL
jgi:hypothetical protein